VALARGLVALVALAAAPGAPARVHAWSSPADTLVERYVYLAHPEHADSGSAENHVVTITTTPAGAKYAFEIRYADGSFERGVIHATRTGEFVSATRRRFGPEGARIETDSLRVEGETLVMESERDGKIKTSRADLPRERPLAVDASLLLWMRGFPFGQGDAIDVFMADWSHRTVNVDVRDRGIETVTTPAGTFACRRMEVTVRVLVFRPKITFWIAVDAPHVLVQHRGKRGPFTPVFETRLIRVETP
jgi:hypothetical protein